MKEIEIPEGYEARIEGNKVILKCKESEDEGIRQKLIETIGYFRSRGIDQQLCEKFLAYLEKQKEQKLAWSKEDKQCLDTAIAILENLGYDGVADNLKHLRPHSKQNLSDEDEKILHAIEFHVGQLDSGETINGFSSSDMLRVLKSLRSQPKQDLQIKEGDKVSIHCRKDRKEDIIAIYDGKVGEVIHVWDAERNPWGHIVVRLDNGCNNGFYEDELEVLNEPKWKLSEEQIYTLERICSNLHSRASDDAPKLDEIIKLLKQK